MIIDLYPFLHTFVEPLLQSAIYAMIVVAIPVILKWAGKQFGVTLTADQQRQLQDLAKTEAGKIIAAGDPLIMDEKIEIHDQRIADAVANILAKAPKLFYDLGVTPAAVADLVHGYLGDLMSHTSAAPAKAVK